MVTGGKDNKPIAVAGDAVTLDAYRIKELIREVLEERSSVDDETHRRHHEILSKFETEMTRFFDERRKWRDLMDFIKKTAIGSVVIAAVGGFFTALAWIGGIAIQIWQHNPAVIQK